MRLRANGWGFIFYWILDSWIRLIPTKFESNGGVVIVKLDQIGDFILWIEAAKQLRSHYQGKKIVLIANAVWADLAMTLPYWDEVWPIHPRRFVKDLPYRWVQLIKIRRAHFDIAIQPTYSRSFMHGDSLIRGSGSRERIGSLGNLDNISKVAKYVSDLWYTQLVSAQHLPMMELERNTEFVINLTKRGFKPNLECLPKLAKPRLSVSDTAYFILFPGGSWSGRLWPSNKFAEVAVAINKEYGWTPVLCGSAQEIEICNHVIKQAAIPCINMSGQTSLGELTEVIRNACLLVSNETSAIHIAVAVGTPSICVTGGGHFGRFVPYSSRFEGQKPQIANHFMPCYGCNWRCTKPHREGEAMPCIQQIPSAQVIGLARTSVEASDHKQPL